MTPMAWATMIAICGLVWGGFAGLLVFALRSEGKKKDARTEDAEGPKRDPGAPSAER